MHCPSTMKIGETANQPKPQETKNTKSKQLEDIGSMENRFFCIKQNSKISEKFELPQPTLDLNSIPSLLALNGQPELGKFLTIT